MGFQKNKTLLFLFLLGSWGCILAGEVNTGCNCEGGEVQHEDWDWKHWWNEWKNWWDNEWNNWGKKDDEDCENPCKTEKKPHIIIMVFDDLGYGDIGIHGTNQVCTPHLDAFFSSGVTFNRHYVHPQCTPTRSAFLTGRNAALTENHGFVLFGAECRGLATEFKILPQYFNDLGYCSHLVGKWHVGHSKKEYLPLNRGFCSHTGYWTGKTDYYTHENVEVNPSPLANKSVIWNGTDIRRGMEVAHDLKGQYLPHIIDNEACRIIKNHDCTKPHKPLLLVMGQIVPHAGNVQTDPIQVPPGTSPDAFSNVGDPKRAKYLSVLQSLDNSVSAVIRCLDQKNMLKDSIIVMTSDNGATIGPVEGNAGSSCPLRGMKYGCWDGGWRTGAAIWSPLIPKRGRTVKSLFHISDWLPTLHCAAGGNPKDLRNADGKTPVDTTNPMDGMNQWRVIRDNQPSPRKEVYTIDPILNIACLIEEDDKGQLFKVIMGSSILNQDGYYGDCGRDARYTYNASAVAASSTAQILAKYSKGMLRSEQVERTRAALTPSCLPPAQAPPATGPQLFEVKADQCEINNIASQYPEMYVRLLAKLNERKAAQKPPNNSAWDLNANPDRWNHTWTNFADFQTVCPQRPDRV